MTAAETTVARLRCSRCYSELEPDVNYCPVCGRLVWPPAAVWPAIRRRRRWRWPEYLAALRLHTS